MTDLEKLKAAYNAAAWDFLVDAPDAALDAAINAFNASAAALRDALDAAVAAQEKETPNE